MFATDIFVILRYNNVEHILYVNENLKTIHR